MFLFDVKIVKEEKHRAPNPCKVKFPEENFIEFTVVQDTNVI